MKTEKAEAQPNGQNTVRQTSILSIRVPRTLLAALVDQARKEGRPPTQIACDLIQQGLEQREKLGE